MDKGKYIQLTRKNQEEIERFVGCFVLAQCVGEIEVFKEYIILRFPKNYEFTSKDGKFDVHCNIEKYEEVEYETVHTDIVRF